MDCFEPGTMDYLAGHAANSGLSVRRTATSFLIQPHIAITTTTSRAV
jgi:hypothetical protein